MDFILLASALFVEDLPDCGMALRAVLWETENLSLAGESVLRTTADTQTVFTAFRGTLVSLLLVVALFSGYLVIRCRVRLSVRPYRLDEALTQRSPICGKLNDGQIHVPPDWTSFAPPKVGQSYTDPVFGCSVKRLTDGSTEEVTGGEHLSFLDYYSTFSPINATGTLILISSNNGEWRIKDLDGKIAVPASKIPEMNNGHPVWDASDGHVFYYAVGNALHKATINGNSVKNTILHVFKEYRGIVSPDAADLSQDGDHIALVGQTSSERMEVFVWSLSKQTKTSVYTTTCKINGDITGTPQPGCLHKLLLTADNLLVIAFSNDGPGSEEGARLWDGSGLVHLQDKTNHLDTGYDLSGKPVFIESGNSHYTAGITNPCPSGWGLDVRQQNEVTKAACLLDKQPSWHVSYRGSASQPWMAISFFDDRKPGPELFNRTTGFEKPSRANWLLFEDEIILARVDGGAVYRMAHARSRSAEGYWSTPRAAISRDGKYVTFSSNMAHPDGCPDKMHVPNECLDVYLIKAL
ncbi:MAG: hypothetical protein DMG37_22605 [Acidobacteria bacterium]|nr:MAG: hypothetical protein DMG37_22605 [Acidobacteriota bacterium]